LVITGFIGSVYVSRSTPRGPTVVGLRSRTTRCVESSRVIDWRFYPLDGGNHGTTSKILKPM
jgi:hypothetical protein